MRRAGGPGEGFGCGAGGLSEGWGLRLGKGWGWGWLAAVVVRGSVGSVGGAWLAARAVLVEEGPHGKQQQRQRQLRQPLHPSPLPAEDVRCPAFLPGCCRVSRRVVSQCTTGLPEGKPRYVMGIGYPLDIVICSGKLPTLSLRH